MRVFVMEWLRRDGVAADADVFECVLCGANHYGLMTRRLEPGERGNAPDIPAASSHTARCPATEQPLYFRTMLYVPPAVVRRSA